MTKLNVEGKVVAITGGSRGLGLYCAEILLRNGAKSIYLTSRKDKAVQEAVDYLQKINKLDELDAKIVGIASDVSNKAGVDHFFNTVKQHEDHVDILIANAGASWGEALETHPETGFDKVLDLNVKGVFLTIQSFYPLLKKAGSKDYSSRVLIMGSIAGIQINAIEGGTYGYAASKAGVMHMGKTLALELGPQNINVNLLAPGFFPTKMSNGLLENIGEKMVKANPKKRLGNQKDIESVVLFFCAKESDYINGAVIPIDGGAHLGEAPDSKL
ncbi:3-oxoacyl-[acyl-carrier-protein] reductase [Wickerhamomyces ciferrii]|uniref:3-oxoacyl-[acyl-carrier-protein] reductase n=1 Tax=Wickerhamomyces ciferrii (strain ATCC 14091 / BCRC 22168 / CBS 111 / JCM 3599 / NBRC 0793 / NRRL Y-1031 F-60-10) TaxID=1206466 RepID=K0KXK7_WICCF|nr:3-oxoacyl-[acyl-carrier-protein] reductase [Wickerhamomyces ciferrii]CCH45773.1 3-oxoacyl-[acyl-carrier-protein] reductase [Wickerhamomyces ciferrii]